MNMALNVVVLRRRRENFAFLGHKSVKISVFLPFAACKEPDAIVSELWKAWSLCLPRPGICQWSLVSHFKIGFKMVREEKDGSKVDTYRVFNNDSQNKPIFCCEIIL